MEEKKKREEDEITVMTKIKSLMAKLTPEQAEQVAAWFTVKFPV